MNIEWWSSGTYFIIHYSMFIIRHCFLILNFMFDAYCLMSFTTCLFSFDSIETKYIPGVTLSGMFICFVSYCYKGLLRFKFFINSLFFFFSETNMEVDIFHDNRYARIIWFIFSYLLIRFFFIINLVFLGMFFKILLNDFPSFSNFFLSLCLLFISIF